MCFKEEEVVEILTSMVQVGAGEALKPYHQTCAKMPSSPDFKEICSLLTVSKGLLCSSLIHVVPEDAESADSCEDSLPKQRAGCCDIDTAFLHLKAHMCISFTGVSLIHLARDAC